MAKRSFVFTKEMADILSKIRKQAGLSQTEVAERIELSRKSYPYISYLESGKIKNPSLASIVLYIRACGGSLVEFFKDFDVIDFKLRHEKMIAQLPVPPETRKIQRDVMRYEIGVEFPSKAKEEIDFTRLKKQIKDKVLVLLTKNQVEENQINSYQRFAFEYFNFLPH